MRRRCKSLAEGAWTYNPGTGESKNPMAMQVHHREWLALASLLYYILRCRIHRLEVLANSDQRGDWCNWKHGDNQMIPFLSSQMGVRILRLLQKCNSLYKIIRFKFSSSVKIGCTHRRLEQLVARQVHDLEVTDSSSVPATNVFIYFKLKLR